MNQIEEKNWRNRIMEIDQKLKSEHDMRQNALNKMQQENLKFQFEKMKMN